MDGYRADLGAILEIFQTMPDYQQSLVISELQRTLARRLELDSEPPITPVEHSSEAPPKPKPKPKPILRSDHEQ